MAILSALFLPLIFLLKVAYFFVPIILGLGSILVFFLIHFRWSKNIELKKYLVYMVFCGVFILTQFPIWKGFVGVEKYTTFKMKWSYAEASPVHPDSKHIILRFVKYPNDQIGIYSKDLGPYLESLSGEVVNVEFRTTWDFGKLRGYRQTKIGSLTQWHSSWGYGGVSSNNFLSP